MLATRSEDGVDARLLQPVGTDADLTVWLGTSERSRKIEQVGRCNRVALVYQDDGSDACLTLIGRAVVVDDRSHTPSTLRQRRSKLTASGSICWRSPQAWVPSTGARFHIASVHASPNPSRSEF